MKDSGADGVQPDMTVLAEAQADAPPTDPDAFVAYVRRHDGAVRALVHRMVGPDGLDDLMQDVYLKAYRSAGGFRGDAAATTWLYRIAYNTCVDELRRRGRTKAAPLELVHELPSPAPDPADVAAARGDLAAALAALPADVRAAVLLVDAQGFDYAAAAEVLGVAVGTVGSRVSRGRAALRTTLQGGSR